ncbi:hypothetical protein F2Q70_00023163 [Brassica cretica]|uniref:Uncharacterized protein n=1 Tax=Brassica cretica TaxID=69181 RepID=A0A8S9GMS3_BRACR|nr:hypothetical protein F2Q70_00023163 [Brassica cretica]
MLMGLGFPSKGNQSTQGQAGSSTSAPQESSTDAMLKHILESQTRSEKHIGYELKNLHTKVNDLNNKFLQLSSHFKALENQFASMPSTSKSPMGSIPGKSEQNPKEYCNVILSTTSEIELSDYEKEKDQIERLMYGTKVVAKAEAQIVEKVEHKIVERVEIQTIKKVEGKVLQPVRHKAEKPVIGNAVTIEGALGKCYKEDVSRATKAAHGKKKMMEEPQPSPLDMMPHTLTLHPMKFKDGAIE